MAESKVHICPECGERIRFSAYLTLPGEYRIKCPNCKAQLQPRMNDFHRAVPVIVFILIIFTAIKQKSGTKVFLIYVGVQTLIAYLVLLFSGYYFIRFKKIEEKE
jgi:uncharacterized protein (DUF983 family)